MTFEEWNKRLQSGDFKGVGGARKSLSKNGFSQAEKAKGLAAIDKKFGVDASAKPEKQPAKAPVKVPAKNTKQPVKKVERVSEPPPRQETGVIQNLGNAQICLNEYLESVHSGLAAITKAKELNPSADVSNVVDIVETISSCLLSVGSALVKKMPPIDTKALAQTGLILVRKEPPKGNGASTVAKPAPNVGVPDSSEDEVSEDEEEQIPAESNEAALEFARRFDPRK